LASVLIASYASIDVADGSGMNLLDIRTKTWDPSLTQFIDKGGRVDFESTEQIGVANSLVDKLGEIDASGEKVQGVLSSWFVSQYGFSPGKYEQNRES
jgi:xylulokinase